MHPYYGRVFLTNITFWIVNEKDHQKAHALRAWAYSYLIVEWISACFFYEFMQIL
jgi:hypothetical protein